jgi:hypothetical protein
MGIPAMANTVVEKTSFAELIAINSEYRVSVILLPEDPEHLYLEILDSNGNILVNDNTIPSSDLIIKRGKAILTVPEYNISLTCSYNSKDAQIGKVFITNFPYNDSKLKEFSAYSDSEINDFKVSGTLFGKPFTSIQGSLLTFYDQILK